MSKTPYPYNPDELLFLPLGGAEQIGMNLNLYGYDGKWLMVDLGVSFGDDTVPGVHVTMPDPEFIVSQRDNLAGIVLTHAHEDHLGAVQYLWPKLRCPVYATPFSAVFLKAKLAEYGLDSQVPIHVVELGSRFDVGPFNIELVTMTHSILEPNALAIRTPKGTVLHTGDWKFDPDPVIGDVSDQDRLGQLGEEGITALVCDSTNALTEGVSGSEAEVRKNLIEMIKEIKSGRIAVACFATNVARLQSIIEAAHEAERCVALVGRSLRRVTEAAREVGYFQDYPNLLTEKDAMKVPRDQLLMICTGSQGEPRSALARIAKGDHPVVKLDEGDTVIFSSREIPGNEKSIGRMQNSLIAQGVEIITPGDKMIHVSGHPARDELARMYSLTRPDILIPVHGEPRHTQAQAELAEACQVPESVIPFNGSVISVTPGNASVIDEVRSGELCVDGDRLVPRGGDLLKSRSRIIWNGILFVTVVLDAEGSLSADPLMSAPSLLDEELDEGLIAMLLDQVEERIDNLDDGQVMNDDEVVLAVRQAIRKPLRQRLGKRPLIEVHLVRAELDA